MSINQRLREALKTRGITQMRLAEHMGIEPKKGQARISHHLRGKDTDSIGLLVAVHELTDARYEWLISGELPMVGMGNQRFVDHVEAKIESHNAEMEARIQSANATNAEVDEKIEKVKKYLENMDVRYNKMISLEKQIIKNQQKNTK